MSDTSLQASETTDGLRLLAVDADDLAVFSTHLQDATVQVGAMTYIPSAQRFAFVAARVDWQAYPQAPQRRETGVHFDHVEQLSLTGFRQDQTDLELHLLSITFTEAEPPSGTMMMTFAGGRALRLSVECIDGQLRDMSAPWPCRPVDEHGVDAPESV